jgi:hypothetical protein
MRNNKLFKISYLISVILIILGFVLSLTIPRLKYKSISNNSVEIVSSLGINKNVIIEDTYKGKNIEGIGVRAFDSKKIDNISFRTDKLKYIERRAFYNSNIENIVIPRSVTDIYQNAFSYSKLKTVTFENESKLNAIPGSCFFNCVDLETIEIPNNIESVGSLAFFNCKKLKEIYLPSGVSVYNDAFYGCNITIHCKDTSNFRSGFDIGANIKIVND